ncbi:helix-turn-helix domain-containing protein [Planctomycetaceae bacterium SH139]
MSESEPIFEPAGSSAGAAESQQSKSGTEFRKRATSVRPLAKLFASPVPIWAIAADGSLAFLSASCGQWLGVAPRSLLGRSTRVQSQHPLDALARALGPPTQAPRSMLIAEVHPPAADPQFQRPQPRQVTFLPIFAATDDFASTNDANPVEARSTAVLAIGHDLAAKELFRSPQATELINLLSKQLAEDPRREHASMVLGTSVWARRLRLQIAAAAETSSHVLLCGHAGSGTEAIANLIELKSSVVPRTELIRVAGPLMDAELFDATTGGIVARLLNAESTAAAPLSAALLIEQIEQMPADAQGRLELLIHNHPQRLRVFATSSLPINGLVGHLLPNLAAELTALSITVPSLNLRGEDIPLIATNLLQRRQQAGETAASQLGRDALDRLVLYPWPDDFRELDGAIRGAARQCRGGTIRVEHLPLAIRTFGSPTAAQSESGSPAPRVLPLVAALETAEREFILRALEKTAGNRAAAARLLEISRQRLLRRIEQLGITWPPS